MCGSMSRQVQYLHDWQSARMDREAGRRRGDAVARHLQV